MRINKTDIEKIPPPEKGYALHWFDELAGFGIRVTAKGAKSYIVQKRIHGKEKRLTVGRYPSLTPVQAKKAAMKMLAEIATGGDPVATKQKLRMESTTLKEAFELYLDTRKDLKPLTVKDMRRAIEKSLSVWLNKPLLSITRDMVSKKHKQLGASSKARANLTMRYLRAIFNFAINEFTDSKGKPVISDNPVSKLSQTKAWYRIDRRQTVIKAHELAPWVQAVLALENTTSRDYLMFVLLTGLRRSEALSLRWDNIDMEQHTVTIDDTKNHLSHTLPLSDHLQDMMQERYEARVNEYVFPGHFGTGHYQGPTQAIRKVTKVSGVSFCMHDLRRTFATVAESLDIPAYALKALLNHKNTSDVTAGYLVMNSDRLKAPMQKITDYFLKAGGIKETAEVVSLVQAQVEKGS